MLRISHNVYGWYASFSIGVDWSGNTRYKYFGSAGWDYHMTSGNEYFTTLEDLTLHLIKEGIDNGFCL